MRGGRGRSGGGGGIDPPPPAVVPYRPVEKRPAGVRGDGYGDRFNGGTGGRK